MGNEIDIAIITAIEVERKAVCKAFGLGDENRDRKGPRTYWRSQVELGEDEFYELAIRQLPDVANLDAALAVSAVVKDWHPKIVLMVGIAGSAKESVKVGDLVIGEAIYYYERGKDIQTGKLPEPKQYPVDTTLWDRVISVAEWDAQISVSRPDGKTMRPTVHRGVIASGEQVIANLETRDAISAYSRKVLAIEMEAYGISAAAWKQDHPVPCLVIRGISDAADINKGDDWQPYSAAVAAEFTKHLLNDKPIRARKLQTGQKAAHHRYGLLVDDLKNGNLIPFLGPGINQDFYIKLSLQLAEHVQQNLIPDIREDSSKSEQLIQTIVGLPCSFCYYWPETRRDFCPMLQNICGDDECPLLIEQKLAVSKIHLRHLSQFYILKNNVDSLYGNLYDMLENLKRETLKEEDQNKKYKPRVFQKFLASLPGQMRAIGYPKKIKGLPIQLIVTTCYDDFLEKTFREENLPFDTVFYVADGYDRGKFKHKTNDGDLITISSKDYDRLPLHNPWGSSSDPRLVILKLFGSWEDNFVTTEQQLLYLANSLQQNLPNSLMGILRQGNILFMGYSPSDSDLQLILNRIWPENRISGKSWLIHQSKPGDLEEEIWKSRNVDLLSMPASIENLVLQLQEAIGERIH